MKAKESRKMPLHIYDAKFTSSEECAVPKSQNKSKWSVPRDSGLLLQLRLDGGTGKLKLFSSPCTVFLQMALGVDVLVRVLYRMVVLANKEKLLRISNLSFSFLEQKIKLR